MSFEENNENDYSIKDKLEDEGIQARNLIKYNVPLYTKKNDLSMCEAKDGLMTKIEDEHITPIIPQECGDILPNRSFTPLSISTLKLPNKADDYRARYWGKMMDTLKRTIDEIYLACETDESEVECKEVIMMLENSSRDFYSLIGKMNLFKEIENSSSQNKRSFAWEDRKISPGKPIMKQVLEKSKRAQSISGQSSSTVSQTDMSTMNTPECTLFNVKSTQTWPAKIEDTPVAVNTGSTLSAQVSISTQTSQPIDAINATKTPQASASISNNVNTTTWADKVKNQTLNVSSPPPKSHSSSSTISKKTVNSLSSMTKSMSQPVTKKDRKTKTAPRKPIATLINKKSTKSTVPNTIPSSTLPTTSQTDDWELVNRNKTIRSWNKSVSSTTSTTTTTTSYQHSTHNYKQLPTQPSSQTPEVSLYNRQSTTDNSNNNNNTGQETEHSESVTKHHNTPINQQQRNKSKSESSLQLYESNFQFSINAYRTDLLYTQNKLPKSHSSNIIIITDIYDEDDSNDSNDDDDDDDDDDTKESIIQLDKKLADVENEKNELENQLGRAKQEESIARLTTVNDEDEEDKDSYLSDGDRIEIHNDEYDDDNDDEDDDGYDIVLDSNRLKLVLTNNNGSINHHNSNNNNNNASGNSSINNLSLLSFDDSSLKLSDSNENNNAQSLQNYELTTVSTHNNFCKPMDWSHTSDEIIDKFDEDDDDSDSKMRIPGRCVSLHQKLSAPLRKSSKQELEEKQAKANEMREKILLNRMDRVRELTNKVEEVKIHKASLLNQKKHLMEQRLNKANQKREKQLEERIKKAQDEELKGKEIAFIQTLEGAQKKHTIDVKHQESEARLLEIEEERKKKNERKAKREAAVENRRKTMQNERQAWLNDLQQKWQHRDQKLASKAEHRQRQRQSAVKAKEAERELKKQHIEQQQKCHIEQLKEKITKKQEDTGRRHLEQLAEISRKAFEMSVTKYLSGEEITDAPTIEPYPKNKYCNLCNVMINSDILLQSHLNGKKHKSCVSEQFSGDHNVEIDIIKNFNLEHLIDAPKDKTDPKLQAKKDRRKTIKKKIKKIRLRITMQSENAKKTITELMNEKVVVSSHKTKYVKITQDLRRVIAIQDTGPWVSNRIATLEKSFSDLFRNWDSFPNVKVEQNCLLTAGLGDIFSTIMEFVVKQKSEKSCMIPDKTILAVSKHIRKWIYGNDRVCFVILFSPFLLNLIDCLLTRLTFLIPDNFISLINNKSVQLPSSMSSSQSPHHQSNPVSVLSTRELPTNSVVDASMEILTILFDCLTSSLTRSSNHAHNKPSSNSDDSCHTIYTESIDQCRNQLHYVLNYIISIGIVDKLSDYLCQVRGPLKEKESQTAHFVLRALSFLSNILKILAFINNTPCNTNQQQSIEIKNGNIQSKQGTNENCQGDLMTKERSQLLVSIEENDMCGLICLLYGLLLYQGNSETKFNKLPILSGKIAIAGLKLINNLAVVSLPTMQNVLSLEGTYLQLRHIISFLISYCTHHMTTTNHIISSTSSINTINPPTYDGCVNISGSGHNNSNLATPQNSNSNNNNCNYNQLSSALSTNSLQLLDNDDSFSVKEMLHELILCVGYFCVENTENQHFIQTGQRPTILQQLTQLPFPYFSQKHLTNCLYPTLISCCFNNNENTAVLEQEMTCNLLSYFIEEKMNELKSKSSGDNSDHVRFYLSRRFNISNWESAKLYFQR